MNIPGISYHPNFITDEVANELVEFIDKQEWCNDLKRKTQHYGYKYNYREYNVTETEPVPELFQLFDNNFEQVIVNNYEPGQGITPHIDAKIFDNEIRIISLLHPAKMKFTRNNVCYELLLEPNSLLIMKDEARYQWKHSLFLSKTDSRRISLTYRNIK